MRDRNSATRPRVAYGLSHVALPPTNPLRMALSLSRGVLLLCLVLSVRVRSVQVRVLRHVCARAAPSAWLSSRSATS